MTFGAVLGVLGVFGGEAAAWGALAYFDEGFDSDEAAVDAGDVVCEAAYFFVEALDVFGGQKDLFGGAHEVVGEAHGVPAGLS